MVGGGTLARCAATLWPAIQRLFFFVHSMPINQFSNHANDSCYHIDQSDKQPHFEPSIRPNWARKGERFPFFKWPVLPNVGICPTHFRFHRQCTRYRLHLKWGITKSNSGGVSQPRRVHPPTCLPTDNHSHDNHDANAQRSRVRLSASNSDVLIPVTYKHALFVRNRMMLSCRCKSPCMIRA